MKSVEAKTNKPKNDSEKVKNKNESKKVKKVTKNIKETKKKAEDIQPIEKKPLIQEIKVESKPKRQIPTRAANDPRDKN